jgi:MoaA/NifB/PqqE/SkfB family radical SAM enzyme
LKDIGVKNLILLGGEPLLRSDIGALVNQAALLKFETIIVVTNGLLLEEKAKELLENGVTHITVSVDGVGGANDAIRGVPGYFEKSIRGIETVQKLKKERGLNVAVTLLTTMLLKKNVDDIPGLLEISKNMDAYWSFNLLDMNLDIFDGIPFSSLLAEDEGQVDRTINYLRKIREESPGLISPDVSCDHMLEYARDYLKGKNRYDFHCVHGYKMIYLGSHGEVYPGCWALDPVGNLREKRLQDILKSKEYRKRVERMYRMDCPGCTNRFQPNIINKHLLSHWFYCERDGEKRRTSSVT